jgi:hypothetical protein
MEKLYKHSATGKEAYLSEETWDILGGKSSGWQEISESEEAEKIVATKADDKPKAEKIVATKADDKPKAAAVTAEQATQGGV